ncbi:MAG: UDP-N-acetylglucosamine 2-epimerase [Gemmatimonas sp. SG8_38_2]|nr:MAG: UDP-N-acetylglucosamine 2-epimerase [Gemmatimonas sp. SG8_38_2]
MTSKKKIMIVMGTRPEVIKLAPVVIGARNRTDDFETVVVATSQHREMLDQMLETFQIRVDFDLDIMKPNQDLRHVTTAALDGLHDVIGRVKPDWVVVQGDTTTTFAGALAAFYHQISVAHVEAGLRTLDKRHPFPEEINRRMTGQIADAHFAPTALSRDNLLHEGVSRDAIWVTGNTGIDALFLTLASIPKEAKAPAGNRRLLVTAHRRENHGEPMARICRAVLRLVDDFPDLHAFYPVHLSPRVRDVVLPLLGNHPRVELGEPLEYLEFVREMNRAHLILTDSGGIQEEAPSLGKPVLVMRETTERPEGIDAGTARLVGTDEERIYSETARLLSDDAAYEQMAQARNPYGDGKATERILSVLQRGLANRKPGGIRYASRGKSA